jgi:hypothetical protein
MAAGWQTYFAGMLQVVKHYWRGKFGTQADGIAARVKKAEHLRGQLPAGFPQK